MSSSREYLDFILEQLSGLEDIRYKQMMGEYIIYYKDKIIGGIYDDRFLIKITETSQTLMPQAQRELPYQGAKEMLLADAVDDREFLVKLINEMYSELPKVKNKK